MRELKSFPSGKNPLQRMIYKHIQGMYELAVVTDSQFYLIGKLAPVAEIADQVRSVIHTLSLRHPPCDRRLQQQVRNAMQNFAKLNGNFTCRLPPTSRDRPFSLEQMLEENGYDPGYSEETRALARFFEAA